MLQNDNVTVASFKVLLTISVALLLQHLGKFEFPSRVTIILFLPLQCPLIFNLVRTVYLSWIFKTCWEIGDGFKYQKTLRKTNLIYEGKFAKVKYIYTVYMYIYIYLLEFNTLINIQVWYHFENKCIIIPQSTQHSINISGWKRDYKIIW
jgi:hypothetical protein